MPTSGNTMESHKRKFSDFINPTVIITLVSWLTLAAFYIGVYRTEMGEFRRSLSDIKINQVGVQTDMIKLNSDGSSGLKRLEPKITSIETKISTLESAKATLDQRDTTIDKVLVSLDTRIVRLEDNVPRIAVLSQMVESVREDQKAMKDDIKKIGEIQIQLIELKRLVEKLLGDRVAQK